MVNGRTGTGVQFENAWQAVAFVAAYVPLFAWGPLLGLVTINYYRRRTQGQTVPRRGRVKEIK
jgi:hypothetical protein